MPAERLPMRKLREILRLHYKNRQSTRAIARSCRISPSTAGDYIHRAELAKLGWPLPPELDDIALERLLFPVEHGSARLRPGPDYALVHLELRKKHVTKLLLWQEYREEHSDGYSYSQFCERYRRWAGGLEVTMRQDHRAGEKVFIDFSGDGIKIINATTGEVSVAKLFLAVLGASNYTYIEPVLSEDLPTWIGCHVRAFAYFGGVPDIGVPDNLKSGVKRADFYDPEVNQTYADLAQHYGIAVIPARKRKPRDKAKVEGAVLIAYRWVFAALRHRDFTSLAELREAIGPLLEELNDKPMQKIGKSRREVFEAIERAALKPLPTKRYELCDWKTVGLNIDYHVDYDDHYYSVHYSHWMDRHRKLEVRATETTVEIFWAGQRIASHVRSHVKYGHSTLPEHRPASHRLHLDWPPSRLIAWAQSVGPNTVRVFEEIMRRRPHPEQGFRSCLGVLRLKDRYPEDRIELACSRAVKHRTFSRKSIEAILKNNLDQTGADDERPQRALPLHQNLRGNRYYH